MIVRAPKARGTRGGGSGGMPPGKFGNIRLSETAFRAYRLYQLETRMVYMGIEAIFFIP